MNSLSPGRIAARIALATSLIFLASVEVMAADSAPVPLLDRDSPVDWWFMFKLNGSVFPGCHAKYVCPFGGTAQKYSQPSGLQFVYASNADDHLQKGSGCAGESVHDPLGATFDEIYNNEYSYVVWNDQFYDNPKLPCSANKQCPGPWGHSKGMVAWDKDGNGLVLQVTTPDWPGSGSAGHPRKHVPGTAKNPAKGNGNTLGCVGDNNILYSQHFFALKLSKGDVAIVLKALSTANVATTHDEDATDETDPEIFESGKSPSNLDKLARNLGTLTHSQTPTSATLSSGVILIAKPSDLHVPPWQMVSSLLDGASLRTATWWGNPYAINSTNGGVPKCWSDNLSTPPGAVVIVHDGVWDGTTFKLEEGSNHAKIGVSVSPDDSSKTDDNHYVVFGDMNQQGGLDDNCDERQNSRGGLFFVLKDKNLSDDVEHLIGGDTEPVGGAAHFRSTKRKKRM